MKLRYDAARKGLILLQDAADAVRHGDPDDRMKAAYQTRLNTAVMLLITPGGEDEGVKAIDAVWSERPDLHTQLKD